MEECDYEKEYIDFLKLLAKGVFVLALITSVEIAIVDVIKSIYGPKDEVKVEAKK
jgi:hypothetical protein